MARWPVRPNTLPTRSNPDPRARRRLSEWNEIGATLALPRVLDRAEAPVDTAELARFLIGKMLLRILAEGVAGGRIVETEAYGIGDPAGQAYRGLTPRNRALFLERGHAYVYLAYGGSFLLNVSSEASGLGAGVLIRAIEPTIGGTVMERNRGVERARDLARARAGCAKPWGLIAPAGRDRPLPDGTLVARAGRVVARAGRPCRAGNRGQPADRPLARD